MEIKTLTPKGRISIPEEIRRDFQAGTAFSFERQDDTIILKKVERPHKKQELTDWAKKELAAMRNAPEESYATLEELEAEILSK